MDLLPLSHTEFSQPDYWNRFFQKRGKIPFEWYGEYPQLHTVIHKYITPANLVLIVGCGNSALSENMYDNGLQHLFNIDISDIVIQQMTDRHKSKRPKMVFHKMDVTEMTYPDEYFNAVLDKGTLDALLVSEDADVVANVQAMFGQIARCLKLGGRYIIISLLQDHVQKVLLNFFTHLGWPIRIHRIYMEPDVRDRSSLSLPVFAVVVTKFRSLPNMPQIVEVCRFEDRIDRLEDIKYLSAIVKDMQYYHIVRQQLLNRLPDDQQVSLELHTRGSDIPRYNLTVVDSPHRVENKFAIFIVPQGSAGFQRLVVVTLSRGHSYENLEAIKAELSSRVMELAPKDCSVKAQIPFLSIGEDIGKRFPVAQGRSDTSGDYLIEDVELNGGQLFRRLVFLSNKNVVQSEARMTHARDKKKRKNRFEGSPGKLRVDKGYLHSDYLIAMVGGFGFVPRLDCPLSCVLVGLGGGSFPSFVHSVFPQVNLDAVELDPSVVDIAQNWFDLTPDERLKVHIADGLDFIRKLVSAGENRDVVVLDVDSKDHSVGLNCPPLAFVEPEFLTTISRLLSDDGIFILNLASRDESIKEDIMQRVCSTFLTCASIALQEDINTVVFASNKSTDSPCFDPSTFTHQCCTIDEMIKSTWKDTNVEVEDMMSTLKFVDRSENVSGF
ncbi:unnamed protein product [Candidula unifasciata]|uniref:Methyltransferase domain-containing protein n=1 Tax=Candidula unifasciata TaxID=100452 RepID=A0A8S3YP60_9EUPU|nr:unnamed protein product [Candidula unifasciata]